MKVTAFSLLSLSGLASTVAASHLGQPAPIDLARRHQDLQAADILAARAPSDSNPSLEARGSKKQHKNKRKSKKCKAKLSTKVVKTESAAAPKKQQSFKGAGLFAFNDDRCGPSGATDEFPNGSQNWLNCGLSKKNPDHGWTPPANVQLSNLKTVSLEQALEQDPSTWQACAKFTKMFESAGSKYDLPPILLASIAMQESSCNPNLNGRDGSCGLMQLSKDKWEGRDSKGCQDVSFNINKGAAYLRSEIDRTGSFLVAIAAYNGWYPDLSYNGATKAAYSGCCNCQNNLDYLQQMLNGYLLGKRGWEMGAYKNLAVCDD